jgi:hypothetical protein
MIAYTISKQKKYTVIYYNSNNFESKKNIHILVMKIVVFDLDETLGYFTQFGIFWDSLSSYVKSKNNEPLSQSDFDDTLDLFPEFIRPNIINILTYLKDRKHANNCHRMMVYTNNNGPRDWAHKIVGYFENKLKYKLIDQVIAAFKVNGERIEIGRTTSSKTYDDLVRCSKIPTNAEICFLDDTLYPGMTNDKIYYINIKPYFHDLRFDHMIEVFKNSNVGKKIIHHDEKFDAKIMNSIKMYNYKYNNKDTKEYEIDKIIGKYIITHLDVFFNKSRRPKTLRNGYRGGAKTRKKYRS